MNQVDKEKGRILTTFTFIDLFAGMGGFHLAATQNGGTCVMACEIDKAARKTYRANYSVTNFIEDIRTINSSDVPNHDLLCAGFPCQPFSQAGFKRGFEDIRGTLFFYIADIIRVKQPKAFFLENVRNIISHNHGETFEKIQETLKGFGYSFFYKVIKASDFGLPQHRPRLFMVGFRNRKIVFQFPEKLSLSMTMNDIFGKPCNKAIGFTLRVGGRGSPINDRRNWDGYFVDGKPYRLQPKDGLKMMGFPNDFSFPVSNTQAMKQLGNSVAVTAVSRTIQQILKYL
ncbi:DNA cytosine methyltransferase [Candidatus Chlamydia corallus]|uniref:DNA cytosine methyltransferase n=1 Tax=Candidatus Chlamydia corallus TaxID=2038470 RepID=UPI000C2F94BC|nr:DNA cytosine methyltransferase [Candidatus Chlamydia corallus]